MSVFSCIFLSTMCMADAHGGQKRVLQTLELEVQASGRNCVGAKSELGYSERTSSVLNC